jgi:hypothetical protein
MISYHARFSKVIFSPQVGKSVKLVVPIGAGVGAVLRDDQTVGAQCFSCVTSENVAFDENLVIASAVDSLVQEVLVQVVVDVLVTKAASRAAGAAIPPVVVVVGDVQMARVDVPESIAIANQGALPVVVKVVPGDSDPV